MKFSFTASLLPVAPMLLLLAGRTGNAQDLEPRAYSASPVGVSFAGVVFGRSSGDIAFDPSIPIEDAKATLYAPGLGLGHTFGLLGRQALVTAALPYAWGDASGVVGNGLQNVHRSGLADVRTRFSINLKGSPAVTPAEFARRGGHGWILGTSVAVIAPSGQYDSTKLINIGTNRWAFKPEVGLSIPVKKFDLDLYAGAWFFTTNHNFYQGNNVRSQAPLTAVQAHVSYTVRRGLWVAVDSTWYGGGSVTVDHGMAIARQNNSRVGATASFPLAKGQSFKVSYSNGVSGTVGSDFSSVAVGWQYAWFSQPHRR
jgi:hypothetical protein